MSSSGHAAEAGGDAAGPGSDQPASSSLHLHHTPASSSEEEDYVEAEEMLRLIAHFEYLSVETERNLTPPVCLASTRWGPSSTSMERRGAPKVLRLPPIKPVGDAVHRVQSARRHHAKELSSQLGDLRQQLDEATAENKFLRQLQHRHAVALQRYEDSQSGLSQVLGQHNSEVRALKERLQTTRGHRDSLAAHLQATQGELRRTKDRLRHLQDLSQDRSLPERAELTHRLSRATTELDEKNKKIQDLERHLELCQSSFNRQIATETKKTNEATKLTYYLEENIQQLSHKIKESERDLGVVNIYSHRFPKGWNRKAAPLPVETGQLEGQSGFMSRNQYPEPECVKAKDEPGADSDKQGECSDQQTPDSLTLPGDNGESPTANPCPGSNGDRTHTEARGGQLPRPMAALRDSATPKGKPNQRPRAGHHCTLNRPSRTAPLGSGGVQNSENRSPARWMGSEAQTGPSSTSLLHGNNTRPLTATDPQSKERKNQDRKRNRLRVWSKCD